MNQDDERLAKCQVVLGIYSPATTFLGLLGGFVYTSIVTILLNTKASDFKVIVTLLLFTFSGLLTAFHFWQLGSLDFTRLKAVSRLIVVGNIFFFISSALILITLFVLVIITKGSCRWNCVWLIWLVLSLLELIVVGFKLKPILASCMPVAGEVRKD